MAGLNFDLHDSPRGQNIAYQEYGPVNEGVQQSEIASVSWSSEWAAALRRVLVIGVLTAAAWHLPLGGVARSALMTLAAMAQLYLPIWRADALGWPLKALGVTLLHTPRKMMWETLLWAALVVPPWVYLARWWFSLAPPDPAFLMTLSPHSILIWSWAFVQQVCGIALPEEVFWRGYIQPALAAWWPGRCRWLLGLAPGAVVATGLFASLHLLAAGDLGRLSTFLPGLVFASMRHRHASVMGTIVLHGFFNVVAQSALGAPS